MAISSKHLVTACTVFSLAFASTAVPQAMAVDKIAQAAETVNQTQAQASAINYPDVLLHPGLKYSWGPEEAQNAVKFTLVDRSTVPASVNFGLNGKNGKVFARPSDDAPQDTGMHADILVTFEDGSDKLIRAEFRVQQPHIRHDIKPAGDPVKEISSLINKDETKSPKDNKVAGKWQEIGTIIGIVISVVSVLFAGGAFLASLGQIAPKP